MKEASTFIIRLYFAVVATVTIFTLMFATVDLLNTALKTWVFTAADVPTYLEDCSNYYRVDYSIDGTTKQVSATTDEQYQQECESRNASAYENYAREKSTSAVRNLAMLIVALPLFLLHFRIVLRDWREMSGNQKLKTNSKS